MGNTAVRGSQSRLQGRRTFQVEQSHSPAGPPKVADDLCDIMKSLNAPVTLPEEAGT